MDNKMIKEIQGAFIFTLLLLFSSCKTMDKIEDFFTRVPEVTACSEALKTSVALSYSTTLAYNALLGNVEKNVLLLKRDKNFVLCKINVNESYPLPLGSANFGSILVAGILGDDSSAVMSVNFADIDISEGSFRLEHASDVPVVREDDTLKTIYFKGDLNSYSDTAHDPLFSGVMSEYDKLKAMGKSETVPPRDTSELRGHDLGVDVWVVKSNFNASLPNMTYGITGVGNFTRCAPSEQNIIQLALFDMKVESSCSANPSEGLGFISDYEISNREKEPPVEIGNAALLFDGSCDGKVLIPVATGNYIGSLGKRFSLGL